MASNIPEGLYFDFVSADEVPAAYDLEKAAFPPEEAATLDRFETRQSVAPELFLGAFLPTSPRTLVGYANATRAKSTTLTAESIYAHDPEGTSVCLHALAVVETHRRLGIASALLNEYIHRLRQNPPVGTTLTDRVLLLCHENLIPLYIGVGFTLLGKSSVVHGPDPWFEMRMQLRLPIPQLPPDMALSPDGFPFSRSRQPPPLSRLHSSFPNSQSLMTATGENAFDILCPRPGCGSLVLKAGVAKYQRRESVELEPPSLTPPNPLPRLPPPPAEIDWWLVTPTPTAFENIAFTRPVRAHWSNPNEAPDVKLLACAECDIGAFGWSKEGGGEFWLAMSRVGYR